MVPKLVTKDEAKKFLKGDINFNELCGYLNVNNGYDYYDLIDFSLDDLYEFLTKNPNLDGSSFDNYKNLSDEVRKDLEITISNEDLSNINRENYKKALLRVYDNLSYEIIDESIKGDNAEVEARVTVINLAREEKESNDYMLNNPEEFYNLNQEFDNDLYNSYRIEKMLKALDKIDYNIIFNVKKKEGIWTLVEPNRDVIEKLNGLYNYDKK